MVRARGRRRGGHGGGRVKYRTIVADMHCCQCRRRGFLLAFEGEGGMKHKPGCFYYEIPEEKRDD